MNPNETPLGVLAFLALFAAAVAVAHYGPTAVRRLIHHQADHRDEAGSGGDLVTAPARYPSVGQYVAIVLVLALICIGLAVLFTSTPVCPAVAP